MYYGPVGPEWRNYSVTDPEEISINPYPESKGTWEIEMINLFTISNDELSLPEDATIEDVKAKIKQVGVYELLSEWNFAMGMDIFVNHQLARRL